MFKSNRLIKFEPGQRKPESRRKPSNPRAICLQILLFIYRHPNFNIHGKNKHWIMQYTKPMDKQKTAFSDLLHRRRLLTLLSADDAIHRLYKSLEQRKLLDNTYIFLSSDHGYHLGQFGMAKGKSQPYETDIRVPFFALGPKVPKGKK